MVNCILAGVGGQGTVLASKLIAESAMSKGLHVRTSETIGMSQRGGCVVSHVRISEEEIYSPLIDFHSADVIIGFEPSEAVRYLPYLKSEGTLIVANQPIKPVTDSLSDKSYQVEEMIDYLKGTVKNLVILDTEVILEQCKTVKVLNTALLGAGAASGILGLTLNDIEKAINKKVKKNFIDLNIQSLHIGAQFI